MSYLDEIRSGLAKEKYDEIAPVHAEALIDALALTMVAEGDVQNVEESEVGRLLQDLEPRTVVDTGEYLRESLESAREASGDSEAVRQRAEDIAQRLDDELLREEAYYLSGRIAAADINVVSGETEVLRSFVQAFDIPRGRLKRLTQRMREEV